METNLNEGLEIIEETIKKQLKQLLDKPLEYSVLGQIQARVEILRAISLEKSNNALRGYSSTLAAKESKKLTNE